MATGQREGFGTVTPYLIVDDVDDLIDFLGATFGIEVLTRLERPDGSVMHAEVQLGDSKLMMGEPTEDMDVMPASLFVAVPDCDRTFADALDAGGIIVMEPTTMPQAGERYGGVADPLGNVWWISTHLEEVDPDAAQAMIEAAEEAGGDR